LSLIDIKYYQTRQQNSGDIKEKTDWIHSQSFTR